MRKGLVGLAKFGVGIGAFALLCTAFIFYVLPVFAAGLDAVNLVSPADTSWTTGNNDTIQFEFNYAGDNATAVCLLFIDDSEVATNSTTLVGVNTILQSNVSISNMSHFWNVTCVNGTDMQTSSVNVITVDAVPPTATVGWMPSDDWNSSNPSYWFDLNCSDNMMPNTLQLWGNWTGTWHANQTNTSPVDSAMWTAEVDGLPEGQHVWGAYCNDSAGNEDWSDANRTLTVDMTPPSSVNFVYPTPDNLTCRAVNWTYVNVTVTDALTPITGCILEVSKMYNITMTRVGSGKSVSCWHNMTYMFEGSTSFVVYANDSAMKWGGSGYVYNFNASEEREVIVDETNPIATVGEPVQPVEGHNTSSSSVTFGLNCSDSNPNTLQLWGNWTGTWHLNQTNSSPHNDVIWNVTVDGIQEGTWIWGVYCNDSAGNSDWSDINGTFTVDQTGPSVSYLVSSIPPIDDANLSQEWAFVNVSVSDGVSVSDCLLEWDGTNYTMGKADTVSGGAICWYNKTDSDGTHTYKVYANDTLNNFGNESVRNVTLDTSPPSSVSFVYPTPDNNTYRNVNWTYVNVTVTDAATAVTGCILEMYNNNYTMARVGSGNSVNCWINITNLNQALYDYRVYANDSVGTNGNFNVSETRQFTTDETPPTATLDWMPSDDWNSSNPSYWFDLNCSDNMMPNTLQLWGNWTGTWHANQTNTSPVDSAMWTAEVDGLPEGQHVWGAYCNDSAGNEDWSDANRTLTVDMTPPSSVNFVYPTPDNLTCRAVNWTYVNVTVTDALTPITGCILEVSKMYNITMTRVGSGKSVSCWHNMTYMFEGSTSFVVYANDSAMKWGGSGYVYNFNASEEREVIVDETNPVVMMILPMNMWYNHNFVINASVIDTGSGTHTVAYRWENSTHNGPWTAMSQDGNFWNATFDITGVPDGAYNITIFANDSANNVNNTEMVELGIDDTAPGLSWNSPSDSDVLTGNVTVNYTVDDSTSGWDYATFNSYCGGDMQAMFTSTIINATADYETGWWDTSTAGQGSCVLQILANDSAGNFNNANITVTVDNIPPTFVHAWLNDTDYFYSTASGNNVVHLVANVTDGESGVANVTANFTFDDASVNMTPMGGGYYNASYTVTGADYDFEGFNTTIMAYDNANNPLPMIGMSSNPVILYNFTVPPSEQSGCEAFGALTTNLSTELDFDSINFIIDIFLNRTQSCGFQTEQGYLRSALLNMSSINMSDPATGQALDNLGDAISVTVYPPFSYGDSYIYVNTTAFAALNTTTTITLYYLPFKSTPAVLADAGAAGVNSSTISYDGENLTFQVYGFSGYSASDTQNPVVTFITPQNGSSTNNDMPPVNVSFNGTGTAINNATILVQVQGQGYTIDNMTCNMYDDYEYYVCNFTSPTLGSGWNAMTAYAEDYGGMSGHNATAATSIYVDVIPPDITIYNPSSGSTLYSYLNGLNYSASDINLDSCWYSINEGPNTSLDSCANVSSIDLSSYGGVSNITVYANDSYTNLGLTTTVFTELCGHTLTSGFTMSQDLLCDDNALALGSSGITLDCAGHKISHTSWDHFTGGQDYGIQANGIDSLTITDCIVDGFSSGIYLVNSVGHTITGNTLYNNYALAVSGIYIENVNGSTISHNNASHCDTGIHIVNSNSNTVYNNTVSFNTRTPKTGIYLQTNSKDNTIDQNTILNNTDYGIRLAIGSTGNTISDNIIRYTDSGPAIHASGSSSATATGNTICDNSQGIVTASGGSVTATGNSFCVKLKSPVNDHILTASGNVNFIFYPTNLVNNSASNNCTLYIDNLANESKAYSAVTDNANSTFANVYTTLAFHRWYVRCNDSNSNVGLSDTWSLLATNYSDTYNTTASTTAGNEYSINQSTTGMNSALDIVTDQNESVPVTMNEFNSNPTTSAFGVQELGRYVSISTGMTSLSYAIIKIYYTDAEVSAQNLDESSLRIHYYNATSDSWSAYDPPDGGVDTANNYVWANTTHFSLWGIGGSTAAAAAAAAEESTTTPPSPCSIVWECEDWSACLPNGTQHRFCENTGTCSTKDKTEERACEYVPPATCSDGILNGDESDVDCGGSCLPCADGMRCVTDADCAGSCGNDGFCYTPAEAPVQQEEAPSTAAPVAQPEPLADYLLYGVVAVVAILVILAAAYFLTKR